MAADALAWAHAWSDAAAAVGDWAQAAGHPLARRIAAASRQEASAQVHGATFAERIAAGEELAGIFEACGGAGGALEELGDSDRHRALRARFARFSDEVVRPLAPAIHRETRDVPDEIIEGAAELGLFGLSIPAAYGGGQGPEPDHRTMLIATEELSRGALNPAGSLITRPEILVRALLRAGTEEQRRRWLPDIAAGRKMVAVAVTEPGFGSDVASLSECVAHRAGGGWVLNGRKRWAGFSARAELIAVLARTRPGAGARGLSLFVLEKPRLAGRDFTWDQPGGGRLTGRAIPALGYRGMHTFDLNFEGVRLPAEALVGGDEWEDRGFHLQMESFAVGRLQTSARAVGVMRAAYEEGRRYAERRQVFGRPVASLQLPQAMLGRIVVHAHSARQLSYRAAARMDAGEGLVEASLAKLYACRLAEAAARDAMQVHGGNGYSEESPIARIFLDARVLTIFEGAEEVLSLRVIARSLLGRSG